MNEQLTISLWIALGGSIGTLARFTLNHAFAVPGTLLANILGSFLLAIIAGWAATKMLTSLWTQYGLGVGFCGALSTMSTIASDTFNLPTPISAAFYVATTIVAGLLASFAGFALGQRICTTMTPPDLPTNTP